jgi:outer membrane protein assembly factor BamA
LNSGKRPILARIAFALALVVAFFVARAARAQPAAPGAGDVRVISVPPPAPPPAVSPKIDPAPANLARFDGRPITRVDVEVDDDAWPVGEPPKVTRVRPGQSMNGAAARRAMDDVLASGRFARARVAAVDDGPGVRLVLHVVQRRLIELLRVDMRGGARERDEMMREADLVQGGEVLGVDMPVYKERVERYLARRGFPTATATITSRETDDPTRVIVIVDVAPGAARVLQRRAFYVFGADARKLATTLESYRVDVGARADENALDAADVALEARLRALGHFRADVSHDLVYARGSVTLRVRVDAGPLTVPRFEGNESYDAVTLAGALALGEETDLAPGHLAQKIRDFYVKRGFLDAEVAIDVRTEADAKVQSLVFKIVEHARVKVAQRAYPCLKLDEVRRLGGGGPRGPQEIGEQIDSYLDEELPGADLFVDPDPRSLHRTITDPPGVPHGARPVPIDLDPDATFVPDTYDRAALHVQELYRNEGYLHAQVGPVRVLRRRCDPRSPADRCVPIPLPAGPNDECGYDATNLPLAVPPLDPSYSCTPDPARGVECEPSVTLRIPVKLGPRTILYDLAFTGARAITERTLGRASELVLGEPINTLRLEDARRKITDLYKEEGYFYADVKYTIDSSVDHTRARVRFDIVEGDQVIVRQIVIRGNERTNDWTIRGRVALQIGHPYRTSLVRKTQERIATLNVFSNISVGLEEPYVPQPSKVVVISVTERASQSLDYTAGISTGEGFRGELGYTHANIGGDAIGLNVRVRLSYLPDELIFDPVVRQNFDKLSSGFSGERLARRLTATLSFPEIGLGPLVRMQIDGVAVHDLEHDFVLDKFAGIPGIYYRPFRELQFALSQSFEHNDVNVFGFTNIENYLHTVQETTGSNADLARLLRVPDGPSHAFAQRFVVTWDRRDSTFNPHKGTLFVSGVEHVDWYSEQAACVTQADGSQECSTAGSGHTLRFTETLAAYVPVTKTITLATELRVGTNVQTVPGSTTYPDRLFFLGGVDSLRGYLQDSLVPQEDADRIAATAGLPDNDPRKFTINSVAFRGGDLMINPRVELRIPVRPPIDTVVFMDAGNTWLDPTYVLNNGITLRTTAGSGVRIETPIGPLAFDYGVNMSRLFSSANNPRRTYEDFGAFHFAIGLF